MSLPLPIHGRGASWNPPNRFETLHVEPDDWIDPEEPEPPPPQTRIFRDRTREILSRNDSPDLSFEHGINPYRGCSHGCVYCLAPTTPILHSDLRWRPIGDVREGDELVGFDEHGDPAGRRRLRRATVEAVWWSRRPTLRLVTECAEVIATAEHRWLEAGPFGWSTTGRLTVGRSLRRLRVEAPEGTLAPAPGGTGTAVVGRTLATAPARIVAIEKGPTVDVVDIQTSTGTFWAAGLASHNCFARPYHEYLGFSAGLDFETKIVVKEDAPALLRKRLSSPGWKPQTLMMSGATDPYQPLERRLRVTRGIVEVLADFRNPVAIITKNHLVTRDLDLLAELARHEAVAVILSITTLRNELQRVMEPRTSIPARRLDAIRALAEAGVPVGVNVAPVIPGLTDQEMPAILEAAARAGASFANHVLVRLPYAVAPIFETWLGQHFPDRKEKVLNRLRDLHGGKLYDSTWGHRGRGAGAYAAQIDQVFAIAARKAGLNRDDDRKGLSTAAFRVPGSVEQLGLL